MDHRFSPRLRCRSESILLAIVATLVLSSPPAFAGAKTCEVNVNVEVTEAGRKFALPAPGHPAYYFPIVGGFREEGAVTSAGKPPLRLPVLQQLAKTLAQQGYLVVGPKTSPPTVLLVFHWGSMNPQIDEFGDLENPQKIFYNQREMVALVGGHTLNNLDLPSEREAVMQGAEDDRYFVVISAFDFDSAQKKQKVLLWRAKMSTASAGVSMEDVVAALVTAGGPHFGRETLRPAWVTAPLENQGTVNLGELKVQEYIEPVGPPSEPPKKP